MKNIGNIIKTLQNIMRKDPGVSGDAQRIEQLGWMISLKILDDKDKEIELINNKYISPIPAKLQWHLQYLALEQKLAEIFFQVQDLFQYIFGILL